MKPVQDTRRENLELLIKQFGTLETLATAAGTSSVYLSQIRNRTRDQKTGRPREMGAAMAKRLAEAAGKPVGWMDTPATPPDGESPVPGVAQLMSPHAVTVPHVLAWESVMQSRELPDEFAVKMPDGALGDRVPVGTALIFKKADTARPRQCVLVEDREGQRYVRRYAQGAGNSWYAQALDDAYISLHSETHGLRVLAVMTWREGGEI